MDTDRNLLFGVLALQADVITPPQFIEHLGIDPFAYLRDVLTRLPTIRVAGLDDFLPNRWQAARQSATATTPTLLTNVTISSADAASRPRPFPLTAAHVHDGGGSRSPIDGGQKGVSNRERAGSGLEAFGAGASREHQRRARQAGLQ